MGGIPLSSCKTEWNGNCYTLNKTTRIVVKTNLLKSDSMILFSSINWNNKQEGSCLIVEQSSTKPACHLLLQPLNVYVCGMYPGGGALFHHAKLRQKRLYFGPTTYTPHTGTGLYWCSMIVIVPSLCVTPRLAWEVISHTDQARGLVPRVGFQLVNAGSAEL